MRLVPVPFPHQCANEGGRTPGWNALPGRVIGPVPYLFL